MIELTEEQRQAIHASKNPCPWSTPTPKRRMPPRDIYERLKQLLEEAEDRQEQKAWLDLATKTRRRWVQENPY